MKLKKELERPDHTGPCRDCNGLGFIVWINREPEKRHDLTNIFKWNQYPEEVSVLPFTVVVLTIARIWKQCKCLSTEIEMTYIF